MPLYDFQCPHCGHSQEKLFTSLDAAVNTSVLCPHCHVLELRQPCAPASVQVHGFNAQNGYASARTITQRRNGITTTVSGNFEAFAGGLHS